MPGVEFERGQGAPPVGFSRLVAPMQAAGNHQMQYQPEVFFEPILNGRLHREFRRRRWVLNCVVAPGVWRERAALEGAAKGRREMRHTQIY